MRGRLVHRQPCFQPVIFHREKETEQGERIIGQSRRVLRGRQEFTPPIATGKESQYGPTGRKRGGSRFRSATERSGEAMASLQPTSEKGRTPSCAPSTERATAPLRLQPSLRMPPRPAKVQEAALSRDREGAEEPSNAPNQPRSAAPVANRDWQAEGHGPPRIFTGVPHGPPARQSGVAADPAETVRAHTSESKPVAPFPPADPRQPRPPHPSRPAPLRAPCGSRSRDPPDPGSQRTQHPRRPESAPSARPVPAGTRALFGCASRRPKLVHPQLIRQTRGRAFDPVTGSWGLHSPASTTRHRRPANRPNPPAPGIPDRQSWKSTSVSPLQDPSSRYPRIRSRKEA